MSPITTYAGFLTQGEVQRVKQQVFSLREHWHDPTPERHTARGATGKFMMLGNALYRKIGFAQAPESVSAVLRSEFDWLYQKLFQTVSAATGRRCRLDAALPPPGFHISELDVDPTPLAMHQDNAILGDRGFFGHALLSLIDAGAQGAWLEYLDSENVERRHSYELGNLYSWGPELFHRIGAGSLKVNPGESRMTFQAFYYVDPTDNHNVLFF